MNNLKTAFIGIGATGAVQAAALLRQDPEIICVDSRPGLGDLLLKEGITVTGALDFHVQVRNFFSRIQDLKASPPDIIFISTKTYHLYQVLEAVKEIHKPGMKFISTHNGLGPEDIIADKFGKDSVFRMSLNFGASLKSPNNIEMTFFNPPNHLGCLIKENSRLGQEIADLFTKSGLTAEFVDDIKYNVWEKMIKKCSLASICAVTDRTIRDVINFPPTREIALGCFNEAIAVAKAMGYDFGGEYIENAFAYLDTVGAHKDSMCFDIANKLPTEIDFLGGKVVEYGNIENIPTPYFKVMTNLVKALEDSYLNT